MLDTQYRMHPTLSSYCSQASYNGLLRDGLPLSTFKPSTCAALGPLSFLNLATSAEKQSSTQSRSNPEEAKLCRKVYDALQARDVAVVTFYRDQLKELRRAFGDVSKKLVEIDTVDAFQGREKDYVIVSCVRAGNEGVGFLRDERRLNVALRARSTGASLLEARRRCARIRGGGGCWTLLASWTWRLLTRRWSRWGLVELLCSASGGARRPRTGNWRTWGSCSSSWRLVCVVLCNLTLSGPYVRFSGTCG